MSLDSPKQLAERVRNLSVDAAHDFWRTAVSTDTNRLTTEHACELLSVARGLTEWYKIMAVLMVGDFYFEHEFIDYAIDMLMFPHTGRPSHQELWESLGKGEDPWAVSLWASNLLASRKTIGLEQYRRISQLPEDAFRKQELLDTLRTRVA